MDCCKLISAFVAIAAIASSCTKEMNPVNGEAPKGQVKTITFTAGNEEIVPVADTKTYINDWSARTQVWAKSDSITVFANDESYKLTNSEEDGATALFTGDMESAASYTALYPCQSAATLEGGKITAVFPSTQTVDANGTDPNALLAVATTTGDVLDFKNVFGLVKFTITETDVTSILIEGNNGETIAGTVEITPGETPSWTAVAGEKTIVLNSADGNAFAAGDYAVAVLPQTFENGIRLILKKSGSVKCAIKSVSASTQVARSGGISVPSTLFTTPSYKYYYILSKADFLAWNGDSANWASTDVVYLGADINFGKARFEKASATFKGTFDGRCHRIYNIYGTGISRMAGVFHQVTGTVKNLCVGSSDYDFSKGSAADAGTYDGYSNFKITGCTAADSWYYAGGVVAYLHENGVMDNVVNFCPVGCKVVGSTNKVSNQRAGGIAGTMKAKTTIKNCTNYGKVEFTSTVIKTGLNDVGGIVSRSDGADAKVQNCVNRGDVHNTSPEIRNIGGIIGAAGGNMTLDNCQNYGDVLNEGNAASSSTSFSVCVSGIIGYSNKTLSGKSNLNNYGNITNSGTAKSWMYFAGVVGYCKDAAHSLTSVENTGDIINNADLSISACMGGVIACNGWGSTYKTISNSGNVINNGTVKDLYIGGIIGYTNGDNTFSGNVNTGDVINNGNTSSLYCGGIIGCFQNVANVTGASINDCTISNTGNITNSVMLGGVAGYGYKGKNEKVAAISSSTVSETVTIENSGAGAGIYMGGIIAYHRFKVDTVAYASKYENDIVKATISNLAGGNSTTYGICLGGIVGYATATVPTSFTGHKVTANISNAGTPATSVNLGGIIGNSSVDWTISSCEANCVLANTSESTVNSGMVIGTMPNPAVTKCAVAGTNNGTDITSANWAANIYGNVTDASGVIVDGSENSCYFLAPAE